MCSRFISGTRVGSIPTTTTKLLIMMISEEEAKSQKERSRLVYLLDAIKQCPKKYKQFVSVVRRDDSSDWYNAKLDRLESATLENILELQVIIRNELR